MFINIRVLRLRGTTDWKSSLSPGKMIATFKRNISQQCWVQHVEHIWPRCCEVSRDVWYSNLRLVKFFMQHLWILHDVMVIVMARFEKCWTHSCALLVWFSKPNISQSIATGWPNMSNNMLRPTMLWYVVLINVAIVWLELANAGPAMLGYVVLICCDHLAGALDKSNFQVNNLIYM